MECPLDQASYAAGDFVAAYEENIRAAPIRLPFGEFPGVVLLNLAAVEQFTHGWGLARAIGRPADLDPGLAAGLLSQASPAISDAYRGPDGQALFGPAREAPARGGTSRPARSLPRPRGVSRAR
jgi:hypothetical protein